MKKIIFIGLMLASLPALAQRITAAKIPSWKVPKPVITTFHKNFASVKIDDAIWEFENEKYDANFKLDGQKVSVTFDKEGKWVETEKRIATDALPADANVYIEKHCRGKAIQKASMINMANGETNFYARVVRKDYIFDAQGKFLKNGRD